MAGIGFELKKIFKERSIISLMKGSFYSSFAVLGPMFIIIISFLIMYTIMNFNEIGYGEKDLLMSIVLYVFIFSLVATSPLSAVISRYIADKIFEEKLDEIMPCYYAGLLINVMMAVAAAGPFALCMIFIGQVDPLLAFFAVCMFLSLVYVFYSMTFISALKEYKSIAIAFLCGMSIAVGLAYLLYMVFGLQFIMAFVGGLAAGFSVIAFILFALVKAFFKESSNKYKDFLSYLGRYKLLFLTNLFYVLGLYVHNFVFWLHSQLNVVIVNVFISAPVYDTATFLAMLTSVSTTIIFTVRVEINFHTKYQTYCQELLGGILEDIQFAKRSMFQTLMKELLYIVQTQMIISIIIFLIITAFASSFGFGGMVMAIYPSMAAGYFLVYIMYCMVVFLYYFDDRTGAAISCLAFFIVTALVSILATGLSANLYGIGPMAGAFAGWTVTYYRLRFIERNLDYQMYCKGVIIG